MNYELFCTAVDKILSYNKKSKINICGYGEPFCNKNIYKMLAYADRAGASLSVASNWTIPISMDDMPFLMNLTEIRITLDGVTNEVYKKSRPVADVNLVVENIEKFINYKKTRGMAGPEFVVRMNMFNFNEHQIDSVVSLCKNLGVDKVLIVKGVGPKPVLTEWNPRQYGESKDGYVTFLGFDCQENNSQDNGTQECIPKKTIDKSMSFFEAANCPWTTIRWDGTICPCCYDENGTIVMGNINSDELSAVYSDNNLKNLEKNINNEWLARILYNKKIACDECTIYWNSIYKYKNTGNNRLKMRKCLTKTINVLRHACQLLASPTTH